MAEEGDIIFPLPPSDPGVPNSSMFQKQTIPLFGSSK